MPFCAPSWRAHMPAQLTTTSHVMSPSSGPHAGDDSALHDHAERGRVLEQLRAQLPRTLRERHRRADRIRAAVFLDVEPGEQVVDLRERKQILDLTRRDLVDVDAAVAIERRDAAILLEPIAIARDLDEADTASTRCSARSRPRAARRDRGCTCASPSTSPTSSRTSPSGRRRATSCRRSTCRARAARRLCSPCARGDTRPNNR